MTDEKILRALADRLLVWQGLDGWSFDIEDEHPTIEECAGYTDFEQRSITVYRELWPTSIWNMIEATQHEFAHAVVGHGEHSTEWWDTLVSIGGNGQWLDENGQVALWSWTREKTAGVS